MAPTSADDRPDVTVVVVVHNDAERLPRAVRSAQAQTLSSLEVLIVDDASTDATGEVAAALAAARPDRVRYHRLAHNSGAAGGPRNVGIELARGRHVIFLDSDDELDLDACRVLLAAARETGADIVAGRCVRVEVAAAGRIDPWFDWLYRSRQDYASIDDKPDLLFDTNSTNKLYPVEFLQRTGLRFPEGRFYEDLEFITKAYVLARGITVVPQRVYLWYIYRDSLTGAGVKLSVTQSRRELKNFTDRIAVHRDLDAFIAEHASPAVALHKDVKFIKIDMKLCVQDIPHLDEELARRLMDELADYLATIRPEAFTRVDPMLRVAAFLLRRRDLAGVVSAADYLHHGGKVSARLTVEGDRVFWGSAHLDTAEGRTALDVTDLGLQRLSFGRLELFASADTLRVEGSRLVIEGTVLNQLDHLASDEPVELALVARSRRSGPAVTAPVSVIGRPDGDVLWRAELDVGPLGRSVALVHRTWSVRLHIKVGGRRTASRVTVRDRSVTTLVLPVRPLARGLAADHLEAVVTPDGDLSLQFVPPGPGARAVDRARTVLQASATARRARTSLRRVRKALALARGRAA